MGVAFLFPGQGSQHPGMLHQSPKHPAVQSTLREANDALGFDVLSLDTASALSSTVAVQLALLISGVAATRVYSEGLTPDAVAGHSVGAFAAAVATGVLGFQDALRVVLLRAQLMEQSFPKFFGMGVVVGLHERKLESILQQEFDEKHPVYLANVNAPDQVVVAGAVLGIRKVLEKCRKMGARRFELLDVSVPSHCDLLHFVSYELNERLSRVAVADPKFPYIGNCNARALFTADQVREDLALSVAKPVRWHDMTTHLYERGIRLFVEMPPGQVLSNLAAAHFPTARSVAVEDAGFESVVWLANQQRGGAIE